MNLLSIQPLNRIAIQFGPLTVYWYGIIIGIGILLGLILATREGKKLQVPSNTFTDLVLYALPISILSARIYYVLFEWAYYKKSPQRNFCYLEWWDCNSWWTHWCYCNHYSVYKETKYFFFGS